MKNRLLVILCVLIGLTLISGCRKKSESSHRQSNEQEAYKQDAMSQTKEIQEEKGSYNTIAEEEESYSQQEFDGGDLISLPDEEDSFIKTGVYSLVGKVGDYPIHMTLDFDTGEGSYSYDRVGQPISLDINTYTDQKNMFYLEEEEGKLCLYAYSKDSFYGVWYPKEKEEDISSYLEVNLQREGTKEELPPKSSEAEAFEGTWYGKNNNYYGFSNIWVYPVGDTLIYYGGLSINGFHMGSWEGFAIKNEELGKRVYERVEYDEYFDRTVYFRWYLEGDQLILDANRRDWHCGMGVSFDDCYLREEPVIKMPTALEVGIAENEEEETLFKKLVQEYYSHFINLTSYVDYQEVWLNDTEKAWGGGSLLTGWSNACYYMKTKDKMYVALKDDKLYYFTNDSRYQSQLPKAMAEWAASYEGEIDYNYVP